MSRVIIWKLSWITFADGGRWITFRYRKCFSNQAAFAFEVERMRLLAGGRCGKIEIITLVKTGIPFDGVHYVGHKWFVIWIRLLSVVVILRNLQLLLFNFHCFDWLFQLLDLATLFLQLLFHSGRLTKQMIHQLFHTTLLKHCSYSKFFRHRKYISKKHTDLHVHLAGDELSRTVRPTLGTGLCRGTLFTDYISTIGNEILDFIVADVRFETKIAVNDVGIHFLEKQQKKHRDKKEIRNRIRAERHYR